MTTRHAALLGIVALAAARTPTTIVIREREERIDPPILIGAGPARGKRHGPAKPATKRDWSRAMKAGR